MSLLRTRWAAVGAAVAVSLGAGGIGLVSAEVGSGDKPVTVLLDRPCRLLETRRDNQGTVAFPSRDTPLGPSEAYTVSATAAPLGNCDLTPATLGTTIVGLVTNVTPVLPTAATDLRLYPTGVSAPETANLNPAPGQPPTPNAVTVGLSGSGKFDVLNKFGEVHVVIDVIGYLADHHHDDRYYTEDETDSVIAEIGGRLAAAESKVAALETSTADLRAAQPFVVTNTETTDLGSQVTATPIAYVSVELTAPVDGQVTVHSTAHVDTFTSDAELNCAIFESTEIPTPNIPRSTPSYQYWMALNSSNQDTISGTRVFDIAANETITYSLACENARNGPLIQTRSVTATFTPAP